MRTIAIANQKGGTAKTTTAVNLAAALAERGRRVLLIDLDPQASASRWLGADDGGADFLDALAEDAVPLEELARPTPVDGVEVVPSSLDLAHAERELASLPLGALRLREMLEAAPAGRWPVVLLDCPPQLGQLTHAGLLAARELLVPVEASSMALAGLGDLLRTFGRIRKQHSALELLGVLVCRVDYRNRISREVVRELRKRFEGDVFTTVIRERVRHREAWSHRQPITDYEPEGDAADDYRKVAGELLARDPEVARVA